MQGVDAYFDHAKTVKVIQIVAPFAYSCLYSFSLCLNYFSCLSLQALCTAYSVFYLIIISFGDLQQR